MTARQATLAPVFKRTLVIQATTRPTLKLPPQVADLVQRVTQTKSADKYVWSDRTKSTGFIYYVSWNPRTEKPNITVYFPIAEYEPE